MIKLKKWLSPSFELLSSSGIHSGTNAGAAEKYAAFTGPASDRKCGFTYSPASPNAAGCSTFDGCPCS